jgi:hypothetical protein
VQCYLSKLPPAVQAVISCAPSERKFQKLDRWLLVGSRRTSHVQKWYHSACVVIFSVFTVVS